jgi:hypothetical protein
VDQTDHIDALWRSNLPSGWTSRGGLRRRWRSRDGSRWHGLGRYMSSGGSSSGYARPHSFCRARGHATSMDGDRLAVAVHLDVGNAITTRLEPLCRCHLLARIALHLSLSTSPPPSPPVPSLPFKQRWTSYSRTCPSPCRRQRFPSIARTRS